MHESEAFSPDPGFSMGYRYVCRSARNAARRYRPHLPECTCHGNPKRRHEDHCARGRKRRDERADLVVRVECGK